MFLATLTFVLNSSYYMYTFVTNFVSFLHTVLPFGLDVGLLGVGAYYLSRLQKPDSKNVLSVFGPEPGTKESEEYPEKVVRCIAHRGAGFDAPENTMHAFKYCVERDCKFIEIDVRSSADGKLLLLHDQGLERLTGTGLSDVHSVDWDRIKDMDIGVKHPNREKFHEARLCLLDEALDYFLANKVRVIMDVKGEDKDVVNGVLQVFSSRPSLYENAAVTCFNPLQLYQIRRRDPEIVGAISYRPYCFSAHEYDADHGPTNPRFGENLPLHAVLRAADTIHSFFWRWSARWCSASAVMVHKDLVSPSEINYWKALGIRCIGWSVNRPLEKLYWRGVLKAPYLANTLLGELDMERTQEKEFRERRSSDRAGPIVDSLLEPESERTISSGQN